MTQTTLDGSRPRRAVLPVRGMDCADCARTLTATLAALPGVADVDVSFGRGTATVDYDPATVVPAELTRRIRDLGFTVPAAEPQRFRVEGLDCADCARTVERSVAALPGVAEARLDFASARLTVVPIAEAVATGAVAEPVKAAGLRLVPLGDDPDAPVPAAPAWWRQPRLVATAVGLAGLVVGYGLEYGLGEELPARVAFGAALAAGLPPVARAAWYSLRARRADMNLLMTVAMLGALALGDWAEGATVMVLFALGNALQSFTLERTRGAVRALVALVPREASLVAGDGERRIAVSALSPGDVVRVRPGERLPADGTVVAGGSAVDQAPITGESMPVTKTPGDTVFAGTINGQGSLDVQVTKRADDTTLARVIDLIETAQASRAPSQQFVDRFAAVYTPVVIAAAAAVAVVPPLLLGQPFDGWVYRALVLLVIACPCALVISTPVALVSAVGAATRRGVLIKGGAALEALAGVNVVAFDKTGTLTHGRPEVTEVVAFDGYEPEEVLALAAAIEARSEHPLAAAVLRAHADGAGGSNDHDHGPDHHHLYPHDASEAHLLPSDVADFVALAGRGVSIRFDGVRYLAGSPAYFLEEGASLGLADEDINRLRAAGKTVLVVGRQTAAVGLIAVADTIRPEAGGAIAALRQAGIRRVAMLTGDHPQTAAAIAAATGVDEWRADLLPADKVGAVAELEVSFGPLAMVGDGVNDAPALARARVGVAMGAAGTDVALETAGVALMGDDLRLLPFGIRLARRTLAVIAQNIGLSLAIKAVFLGLGAFGVAGLWAAVLADVGTSLVVTLNSMRLFGTAPDVNDATAASAATAEAPAACGCCSAEPTARPLTLTRR